MNIVVCLKQVPGTSDVKIETQNNTLVRQGIQGIINPFDTFALEEGIRLREQHGGRVTALTMGPPQAEGSLREAVSLGADEAVLLSDIAFAGADTWATAYTLSKAIASLGDYDIIICGRQTVDGDTGQVGPEMAEMLEIPFIAYVSKIEEIGGGRLRVRRMVEDGYEVIESSLPALITVVKEINTPRVPSLRGIMKSKSIQVPVRDAASIGAEADKTGLAGSCTRVIRIFYPRREHRAEMLEGDTGTQIMALLERLQKDGLA